MPLQRQLVIFSADSARASLTDLAGLLMGAAHVTTMGGTARVSVQVDAAWRVHALAAEFAARGLSMGWAQDADGEYWVRTSYARVLVGMRPPSFLDGLRLRLWFMAGGRLEDGSIVLRLGNNHAMARRALAPLGLDGAIETGPAIRITGAQKVTRFGDLIGERPPAAPEGAWPPPRRVAPAEERAAAAGGKRTAGRGTRAGNGADTAEDLLVLGQLLGAAAASDGEKVSDVADQAEVPEPAVEKVAKKRVTRKKTEEVSGEQTEPETAAGEGGKAAPRKRSPRKAARGKEIPESAAEGAGRVP